MSTMFKIKNISFNGKIAITLLLLAFFLITILFLLIVPKMQEEAYQRTMKEIEQVLSITQEQIKVAGKALTEQSRLEKKATKYFLELEVNKIKKQIKDKNLDEIKRIIDSSPIINHCSYALNINSQNYIKKNPDIYKSHHIEEIDIWEKYNTKKVTRTYVNTRKYFFFTKILEKNKTLTLFCEDYKLNKTHSSFEKKIKVYIQNSFNTTQDLHKGKTYLFWINSSYKGKKNTPLYTKDLIEKKKRYSISNMSNVENISTGSLSKEEILKAMNKEPITHMLNGKEAISWIRNLSENENKNYTFLLVKTLYKEDLINRIDSVFLKILPASLLALLLAIITGFYLLKRQFKSINQLAFVAKQINQGNTNTRSGVKGNDDIGILGIAFDNMIDNFENNIKILDEKVEEKTKELKLSLEEKEILLKEIHHRVKNNLALTISLIKLQQAKIEDIKTKKILIDIQERIYTMELLHRKLYQSSNLNSINFKEYIETLVSDIKQTYDYNKDIEVVIKIEDIFLDIEKAMPCGLILNELITNSFKYAFKETKEAKLCIHMKKDKDTYKLIYKDNGQGLPKNINMDNPDTLGLKLIKSIAKLQLNGTLSYKNKKGLKFKIVF